MFGHRAKPGVVVNAHVVYIITKLELGGAQKVCLTLAQELTSCGIGTTLISGSHGRLVGQARTLESVILLDEFKREVTLRGVWAEVAAFFTLVGHLRRLKKQYPQLIVHTHSTKAGLLGRWAAWYAGVKHRIHTVHGFGFHAYQSIVSWTIIMASEWVTALITTRFVCVSQLDQAVGSRWLPGFKRKNVLIRAAVENSVFPAQRSAAFKADGQFIIGTVSCFKPQKNLIDLLRAFHALYNRLTVDERKQVKLQLIGDGVQRPMLTGWIKSHGLEDAVELLGWQEDVSSWMKQWDLFALSSLWEGLPCAVIEARLSKLPVVAYNVGGIHEVIQDGVNGYLIKPQSWESLSERMELLLRNPELHQRVSQYPDELTDFYNQTMVQHHVQLYQSALNGLKESV